MVNTHLDNRTKFLKEKFGEVRSKKYSRDGLTPRNNSVIRTSRQAASDKKCQRHMPINLTQQTIDPAQWRNGLRSGLEQLLRAPDLKGAPDEPMMTS